MAQINFNSGAVNPVQCISDGWQIIKNDYLMYFGIAFVAYLLTGCIPIVNLFLIGPVTGGVFYCLLRRMRGEYVSFGDMFKGFDKFVPLMLVGLIQAIPGIIIQIVQLSTDVARIFIQNRGSRNGSIFLQSSGTGEAALAGIIIFAIVFFVVAIVIGIAWAISFFFAFPLIIEHNLGVVEAITTSARAGWSNFFGLLLLIILEGLIVIAGALALCIGIFFVLPILYAANAVAYRQVFPVSETFAPSAPPPPTDYGTDYGRPTSYTGAA